MVLPPASVELPSANDLADELEQWRRRGVRHLHQLRFPGLGRAAQALGLAWSSSEGAQPAILKELVRTAMAPIALSASGRCATVLLGLDPNTFDLAPHLLREDAAEVFGLSVERFRRDPQRQVLLVVANAVLESCSAYRARLVRLAMEHRHPADTRLAVHWLTRFETYFTLWTPLYGMAADLTAYRETIFNFEQPPPTSEDEDHNPQRRRQVQAEGYAQFALYHFASALAAEQRFVARFGGLWLLSSPEAELEVRNAVHAMRQLGPMNERDHSWLRALMAQAQDELHPFLSGLRSDGIGRATWEEWSDALARCGCTWQASDRDEGVEYHPTARYVAGIRPDCQAHQLVEASARYCEVIEHEWLKVADWYHVPTGEWATPFGRTAQVPGAI